MNKKIVIFFLVSGFFTAALPMHTLAAKQAADDELLGETLMLMKMDLETMDQSGDLAIITSKTAQLMDDLLMAVKSGNSEWLQPVIADYVAEVNLIEQQQLVEECSDALITGLFYSGWSLLQVYSDGGD